MIKKTALGFRGNPVVDHWSTPFKRQQSLLRLLPTSSNSAFSVPGSRRRPNQSGPAPNPAGAKTAIAASSDNSRKSFDASASRTEKDWRKNVIKATTRGQKAILEVKKLLALLTAAVNFSVRSGAYREEKRGHTVPGVEKPQQCRKYFLQYRAFAPERPLVWICGRQARYLPWAPSSSCKPLGPIKFCP